MLPRKLLLLLAPKPQVARNQAVLKVDLLEVTVLVPNKVLVLKPLGAHIQVALKVDLLEATVLVLSKVLDLKPLGALIVLVPTEFWFFNLYHCGSHLCSCYQCSSNLRSYQCSSNLRSHSSSCFFWFSSFWMRTLKRFPKWYHWRLQFWFPAKFWISSYGMRSQFWFATKFWFFNLYHCGSYLCSCYQCSSNLRSHSCSCNQCSCYLCDQCTFQILSPTNDIWILLCYTIRFSHHISYICWIFIGHSIMGAFNEFSSRHGIEE